MTKIVVSIIAPQMKFERGIIYRSHRMVCQMVCAQFIEQAASIYTVSVLKFKCNCSQAIFCFTLVNCLQMCALAHVVGVFGHL